MFCYIVNILMVTLFVMVVFALLLRMKGFLDYVFFDEFFLMVRMVLTIPILILWVNNITIWSKKDKSVRRFLLLFFLNGLYNPIYFKKVLNNNWV